MTYNFTDEPTPVLSSHVDSAGALRLDQGSTQGDLITEGYSGGSVSVTITPPRGWQLDSVTWPGGGNGTLTVPDPGVEESHQFVFAVSQNGTSMTGSGTFKVKKQGNGGQSGG